jgi:hypothetical protein
MLENLLSTLKLINENDKPHAYEPFHVCRIYSYMYGV